MKVPDSSHVCMNKFMAHLWLSSGLERVKKSFPQAARSTFVDILPD